jgi:hypothetical protein
MDVIAILDAAIEKSVSEGYLLVCGTWGLPYCKFICPLSAIDPINITSQSSASKILKVSPIWIESFVNGFDGHGSRASKDLGAYYLGKYFREKYKPKNYFDVCFD